MRLTKKWIAEFIMNSNKIEGYNTPEKDILEAMKDPKSCNNLLITNQLECIEYVKKHKKVKPNLSMVCELHRILLRNIETYAGVIRSWNVSVGKHHPPKWEVVYYHLDNWVNLWRKKPFDIWDTKDMSWYRHCEYEHIHPFGDGNGRSGRLLYLWDCLHNNIKMDIIKGDERFDYYESLTVYRDHIREKFL